MRPPGGAVARAVPACFLPVTGVVFRGGCGNDGLMAGDGNALHVVQLKKMDYRPMHSVVPHPSQ